jgi:RNA recognition motif-containing protein
MIRSSARRARASQDVDRLPRIPFGTQLSGDGTLAVKIYVGNLSFKTSEASLRDLFSQYGEVGDVSLITDRDTGRPRGFGFVEMRNDQAARDAIRALDGNEFEGRALKVNEAKPRTDRPAPGGGGSRGRW